jgi:hypothetical protein
MPSKRTALFWAICIQPDVQDLGAGSARRSGRQEKQLPKKSHSNFILLLENHRNLKNSRKKSDFSVIFR